MTAGDRLFARLLRMYPREFRERYHDDLVAFFVHDRANPQYGSGPLRPWRFWSATLRDLFRAAVSQRRAAWRRRGEGAGPSPANWLGRVRLDVRHGWRGLWASPGITFSALAVLTLGVGAGTSVFSVVDAVALRGLPFENDQRIVSIAETDLTSGRTTTAAPQNYIDWQAQQDVFETMGAFSGGPPFAIVGDTVEPPRSVRVYGDLFGVLGVPPERGRAFARDDERVGAARVAVISDRFWRRRFQADPGIVGRVVKTSAGDVQIVGVMPPGFSYPLASVTLGPVDVWTPFVPPASMLSRSGSRVYTLSVIARLKPGVTIAQANERMTRIRNGLARSYPQWFAHNGVIVRRLQDAIVDARTRSWMFLLLGAVAVVVILACLNAANLLVARAVTRGPELALRTALGARRSDLARSLFIESLLLSALGTAGGMLAAAWGVQILRTSLPPSVPRLASVALDVRVLVIAAAAAVVTAVAFGTIPALQASRPDLVTLLAQAGRSRMAGRASRRLRAVLVGVEIVLAVVLLSGSMLFLTSFLRVTSIDLGFDPRNVAAFLGGVMSTSDLTPPATAEARVAAASGQTLAAEAVSRVRAVPGVIAATAMQDGTPLSGSYVTVPAQPDDGRTPPFTDADEAVVRAVGAEYLDVIGASLSRGRWIASSDTGGSTPVVVLSDVAAAKYFPGRDGVGQILRLGGYPRTVVGIVRAMRWQGPESPLRPEAFVPFAQTSHDSAQILVKTDRDPGSIAPAIQDAIRAVMPAAAVRAPELLERDYAGLIEQRRFNMIVLVIFGGVALAVAAIGVYGLIAFLVAQGRHEMGVRVALGATPSGIVGLILRGTLRLLLAGLAPGLAVSFVLERTARAFLFEARPYDASLYAAVAGILLVAGIGAALGPARKATRVDPLVALRQG